MGWGMVIGVERREGEAVSEAHRSIKHQVTNNK